jgi:hypothetical protein
MSRAVQGRAERLVERLQGQAKTVARQAERLAAVKKPRGRSREELIR